MGSVRRMIPQEKIMKTKFFITTLLLALVTGSCTSEIAVDPTGSASPTFPVSSPPPTSVATPTSETDYIYLSDIDPLQASVGHASLGRGINPWTDGSMQKGQVISSGNVEYPNGLFAHAPSSIVYFLDGQAVNFTTSMLVHDNAQCGDGVIFHIILDGVEIYTSRILNSVSAPETANLNIADGNLLILKVEMRSSADCDWAIWGNPLLTLAKNATMPSIPLSLPYLTRAPSVSTTNFIPSKMVWAIYYPWYTEEFYPRSWSSTIWTDRPLTPYESYDPEGIRQHIIWAKSAGIDGFLVEWCGVGRAGDNDVLDETFNIVLDTAYQMNFKIAAYYDQLCVNNSDQDHVQAQIEYLLANRATHPAYYWMNGKPVVVIYNSAALDIYSWQSIFENLDIKGLQAIYIGESYDRNDLTVFNGLHQYFNLTMPNLIDRYNTLTSTVIALRKSRPLMEHFWVATVSPGLDNTPLVNSNGVLSPEDTPTIIDRQGEQTFRTSFERAIASGADWIFITSWNEWQENTHIEPSQMYSDSFLQITKQYTTQWKQP